jgi:hypothetical protein
VGSLCEECRWLSKFGDFCLLGRNQELCDSPRARRGDDGLAVRLLDAYREGKVQEDKIRQVDDEIEETIKE